MATYLFRLGNFCEWPLAQWPEEGQPLTACLIGRDPFRSALEFYDGKLVRGRRFTVRRLSNIQESEGCHLLYVGAEDRAEIRSILYQVRERGILTVGIGLDFVRLGGGVSFVMEGRKVRIALNPTATRRSGLSVSSKLLEMSLVVGEEAP